MPLAPVPAAPASDGQARATGPVPCPADDLIGRAACVEALAAQQQQQQQQHRLVSILGPGGIGKTRLALELVRQRARQRTQLALGDGLPGSLV